MGLGDFFLEICRISEDEDHRIIKAPIPKSTQVVLKIGAQVGRFQGFYITWSCQRIAPKWISQADHWQRQGIKAVQGLIPGAALRRPATSQKSLLRMLHVDTCRTSNFETTGGESRIYRILKV